MTEKNENIKEKSQPMTNKELAGCFGLFCALLVWLAICGWDIIWGAETYESILGLKDIVFKDGVFAFRINQKLYGVQLSDGLFFSSPVLSWIGTILGFLVLGAKVPSNSEEKDEKTATEEQTEKDNTESRN